MIYQRRFTTLSAAMPFRNQKMFYVKQQLYSTRSAETAISVKWLPYGQLIEEEEP